MRKIVGGGMRQAGIIAAAGIYALEHHVDRLAKDHKNAEHLATGIDAIPGLRALSPPQTNLVYLEIDPAQMRDTSFDAATLSSRLRSERVLANPLGSNPYQMRMVAHLDITAADIDRAIETLRAVLQ
jgi:threonine aldolase